MRRPSWKLPGGGKLVRFARFVAVLLALTSLGRSSRSEPDTSAVISVTAKLVEIPSKPPPDDLYDYAFVMRYEVVGGPLDKSTLLVAHYKPLQPRSKIKGKMKEFVGGKLRSFIQGETHKLKLQPDVKKVWKGPLIDDFSATDRKSVRYWCLEADPA